MATPWPDNIRQAISSTGTGPLTLGSAATGASALDTTHNAAVLPYIIKDSSGYPVETGWGTYTHSGPSFARSWRDWPAAAVSVTTSHTFEVGDTASIGQAAATAAASIAFGRRLSLVSGDPVPSTDTTGAAFIYDTPFGHNNLVLWDGVRWAPVPEVPEFGSALGTKVTATNYDVPQRLSVLTPSATNTTTDILTFGAAHGLLTGAYARPSTTNGGLSGGVSYFVNVASSTTISLHTTLAAAIAGTSKVDLTANVTDPLLFVTHEHTAWSNDTTRATAVTIQDGRYCKSGDKTRLYLGTFRTTSTTTTEDSMGGTTSQAGGRRFLWNAYNRRARTMVVSDFTDNWSNTNPAAWREMNGVASNCVEFVQGLLGDEVVVTNRGEVYNIGGTLAVLVGIGINSTTAPTGLNQSGNNNNTQGTVAPVTSGFSGSINTLGYNKITALEKGGDGTYCLFLGDNGGDGTRTGMSVTVMA